MEVSGKRGKKSAKRGAAESQSQSRFDCFCQPCDVEGIHLEAEGFCETCDEYLCKACFQIHTKPTVMKNHVLQDKKQMPRVSSRKSRPVVCTELCRNHPGEVIKYFCCAHDQVGCSECMRRGHGSCNNVLYIPEAAGAGKYAQEYTGITEDLKNLSESVKDMKVDAEQNMEKAKKCEMDALYEVDNLLADMQNKFERAAEGIRRKVKAKRMDIDAELLNRCSELDGLFHSIEQVQSDMSNKSLSENKGDLFVAMMNGKKQVQELTRQAKNWKQKDQYRDFFFQSSKEMKRLMSQTIQLGSLVEKVGQERKTIIVSVMTMTGRTEQIIMDEKSTVEDLFKKSSEVTEVPVDQIRLIHRSRELATNDIHKKRMVLSDYGITDGSIIHQVCRLKGD